MSTKNETVPFLQNFHYAPQQKFVHKYQNILGHLNISKPSSGTISPFITHGLVFVATSILWGSLYLLLMHISPQIQRSIKPLDDPELYGQFTAEATLFTCGKSTPEAKNLGCQYDILSNHWVPDICMDQAAVEEYQSDGSWFGYADENRTELITIDTMSEMDFYYTSERDHIVHCAMLWRKQYRAFFDGRKNLDSIIASHEHTMHCSQFLIDMSDRGTDFWNMPIKTYVGWAGCWVRN